MFSGIIKQTGVVTSLDIESEQVVLGISSKIFYENEGDKVCVGDSVAVNGVCLTVTSIDEGVAFFDLATETCRRTTLTSLSLGVKVNLERSLRFGERLDGHLVQGHVDAIGELIEKEEEENTVRFLFSLPEAGKEFIAPKGSISIDGVSLTVGEVSENAFGVYIIPYTLSETIFGDYKVGDKVNLETDCIARYLKQLVEPYLKRIIK